MAQITIKKRTPAEAKIAAPASASLNFESTTEPKPPPPRRRSSPVFLVSGLIVGAALIGGSGFWLGFLFGRSERIGVPVKAEQPKSEQPDAQTNKEQPSDSLGNWGAALESAAIRRISDVDVALGYKFSTVYVPENAEGDLVTHPSYGIFFPVGYRKLGEPFGDPTAGFIPISGEPQKIEYSSSNERIVKVYKDGSAGFRSAGKADVTIRVAGQPITVRVTVIALPFIAH